MNLSCNHPSAGPPLRWWGPLFEKLVWKLSFFFLGLSRLAEVQWRSIWLHFALIHWKEPGSPSQPTPSTYGRKIDRNISITHIGRNFKSLKGCFSHHPEHLYKSWLKAASSLKSSKDILLLALDGICVVVIALTWIWRMRFGSRYL